MKTRPFERHYGDAIEPTTGALLRVQEVFQRDKGRLIAIRPGIGDWLGHGLKISPDILPDLITALQAAQRHTERLREIEREESGNG